MNLANLSRGHGAARVVAPLIALACSLGCEKSTGPAAGFTATRIDAGGMHACGLAATGAAYCWGRNASGELGDGTLSNSAKPMPVIGGLLFSDISVGKWHTCAIATGGAAYCWGFNTDAELGDGDVGGITVPTKVSGSVSFVSVSAGSTHTCALTSGGDAYCWGSNSSGELGIDSATGPEYCAGVRFGVSCSTAPLAVHGGLKFSAVSTGERFSCGLTAAGAAYCWGLNSGGQLGDGTTISRNAPVAVTGGHTFLSLSAGYQHACALAAGGVGYCWGVNAYGQVGNASGQNATSPVQVTGAHAFTVISAGLLHTCGITADGSGYCWGNNTTGALGNGTINPGVGSPYAVAGAHAFSAISAGYQVTAAMTGSGVVYGWGTNEHGELGDGGFTSSPVPVVTARP